jgi:hypothetical protein
MRTLLFALICLLFLFSCDSDFNEKPTIIKENSRTLPDITRILFIGNSHTNRNNIPKTIQLMASSAGDSTYSHNETQPGYSLAQHCARKETIQTIDSLKWDFVVIQEQGGIQAFPETMVDTAVFQYTEILIDAIKKNSRKTKIILYMAHAYREGVLTFGDTYWAGLDTAVANYVGMQDRIRDNYVEMLNLFDAEVAPGGVMWKMFKNNYPEVNLYNTDGIHALPNGSYLLACSIYSTIFRKSPIGKYIPSDVKNEEAVNMQNMTYQSLFKGNPDWKTY